MQSLPLSCTVVERLCWLLPRRFSNTSARLLCFCREVQGQGWNQPREIEVSILYRNAVWALQAGKFKGSIGIQSLHTQVRFWEEKQSLSSGLAPVQTTTEASAQGWDVLRLESLILRACPQLPFGRKHPGAWAPHLGKVLCVILGEISVGEGVCWGTRGREHYLVRHRTW